MYQRLPKNYIPTHYELYMHIKQKYDSFEASVSITFQKKQDSDEVKLNVYDNICITSIKQNDIPLEHTIENDLLTITKSPTQDFTSYPIQINYLVHPLLTSHNGFYSECNCYFTKFEPNYAPSLLPCFDDPSIRSSFTVKLCIPTNLTGITNMPIETIQKGEEETTLTFQVSPPMCTYLLCICIGQFDYIEGQTKSGLPVKMYSEKGRSQFLQKHLEAAISSVEWMENETKTKYELPHLQLISHKGIYIGMENYGLICLSDYTRGADYLRSSLTVMHEVSHLWYGDLVSVEWWDSVWLNEGFAQLHQYLILGDVFSNYKNRNIDLFIERDGLRTMSLYFDNEKVVPKPEEIDFNQRVLKSVIYIKGAYILKMFSDIVGMENFYLVCSNWMQMYRNKSADVSEFISVVNSSLNKDFSKFFNVWLKNVGFPFVNVVEIYDDKDSVFGIRLSQLSFSNEIYQFNVPIVYEVNGEVKKMTIFMDEAEKDVVLQYDWVLVNDGAASLCPVIYSKFLLEKLVAQKNSDKISPINCDLIANSPNYISGNFEVDEDIVDLCSQFGRDIYI